jgi:hypothetical protein
MVGSPSPLPDFGDAKSSLLQDDYLHRKENACCVIVMETNITRSTARSEPVFAAFCSVLEGES